MCKAGLESLGTPHALRQHAAAIQEVLHVERWSRKWDFTVLQITVYSQLVLVSSETHNNPSLPLAPL